MRFKRLIHINFYIFYIILKYTAINSKEFEINSFNCKNNSFLYSPISPINEKNDYNMKHNFYQEIIGIKINIGRVQYVPLYNENIYYFNLNLSNYNNESEFLVHFYPFDCHIEIEAEKDKNINFEKISNFEYDSYYVIIKKGELESINIKIKPLIYSLNEIKKKKTYYLAINSFENNNKKLILEEQASTLLYFNNNLTEIQLLYELNKTEIYPIVISFFIKERVKFEVIVSNGKENIFSKTIAYTDKILINPNYFQKFSSYIYFSIKNIQGKDAVMITNIIGNYFVPIYLHNNILHLGFIPTNVSYQYFYMEVYEGEEGEIILNNKKHNGKLEIYTKEYFEESQILDPSLYNPKGNGKLSYYNMMYNEYSQKLSFYSYQTAHCKNGCYLFFRYYSCDLNAQTNIEDIYGTEFTLLGRIWDEQEFSPQIINIPLNEYIFGNFDFYETININYFTIFIPEDTENIIFEIQGKNIDQIKGFIRKGIIKINSFKETKDTFSLNDFQTLKNEGKYIINLNCQSFGLPSFERQYISFAFNLFSFPSSYAHYYFRILQVNSTNNFMLYPLDSNKNNLCQTSEINGTYSCFFLIKNNFKELSNDFIIYCNGKSKIQYSAWAHYNDDYYSIDLDNCETENKIIDSSTYLRIIDWKNTSFIIIRIDSPMFDNLTIITNFHNNIISYPSIQLYSYQLYYLDSNITFYFNYSLYDKYNILINNYMGKAEICKNDNCNENNNIVFSGKKALSFIVSNIINNISFNVLDDLIFTIKIDYEINNDIIKELFFDNDIQDNIILSVGYYLKEIEYGGADINFYFNFDKNIDIYNENNNILITGFIVNLEYIKYLNSIRVLAHPKGETAFRGNFDMRTLNGLLVFDKEYIVNKTRNNYYFFTISSNNPLQCSLEVNAYSKNTSYSSIPMNKYISGSFDLLINKTIQNPKYYIHDDKNENNTFIIDFSSNYKNIELIFSDTINCTKTIIIGGVIKYYIKIIYSKEFTENYFQVQINNTNKVIINNNQYLEKAYYILKYYRNSNDKNISQVIDISHHFNKEKYELILKYNNQQYKNEFYNYNFTYFLKIYMKSLKLKDELLNTTVQTFSKSSNTLTIKQSLDRNYIIAIKALQKDEEYVGSLFIRIENENDKEEKYYYSITFDFNTNKEIVNDDDNLLFFKIFGIILIIIIVIILIIFILFYTRIKKKNKILKEKVEAISFSSGIDEDTLENSNKKSVKKSEDYETTFI